MRAHRDDRAEAERLDAYLDALVRGQPVLPGPLDPTLAATARRMQQLQPSVVNAAGRERISRRARAGASAAPPRPPIVRSAPAENRRSWRPLVEAVAFAAAILLLVGALVGLGLGLRGGSQGSDHAAVVPATGTPPPGPYMLEVIFQRGPASPGGAAGANAWAATRDVIARRARALGIAHVDVEVQGNDRIVAYLGPVPNEAQTLQVLQDPGRFEIIDTGGVYLAPGTPVRTNHDLTRLPSVAPSTPTCTVVLPNFGTPGVAVRPCVIGGPVYPTIVSTDDVQDAFPTTNQVGQTVVGFTLKPSAAARMLSFTSAHIGQPAAEVLDGEVLASFTINGAVADHGIVEGVTLQQVQKLVIFLKTGELPVLVNIVQVIPLVPTGAPAGVASPAAAGQIGHN